MNKFLIATLVALTPYNSIAENSQQSVVEKPNSPVKVNPGCLSRDEANKVIENGDYVILVRGTDPLKRIIEIWFNGKKDVVVFTYEKPKDDKPENIKEVCIQGFGEDIVFNGDAVDLLKKALDNVNPPI